jgi:hypothetical protein
MKAVRVSRGRRGSSVQTRSGIVGVSSRWAAIPANARWYVLSSNRNGRRWVRESRLWANA